MDADRPRRLRAALVAALCFTLAVPLMAALLFFPVMLVAGPHSDLLPNALQPAVLLLGWLSVVAVPAWCARAVYGRLTRVRTTTRA